MCGILKNDGQIVVVGYGSILRLLDAMRGIPNFEKQRGKKLKNMVTRPNHADLITVKEMVEEGRMRVVLDKVFPLDQAAEAMHYLETGRAADKVVIRVQSESETTKRNRT